MKSVGIIIYFLKQELIGNNGLNVKRAYEEILKVIERDINQRGGINGVKLKIHLLILDRANYVKEVTELILKNDNIICCHGT